MNEILHITNLCKTYINDKRQNNVLKNVNLTIRKGEALGLVGEAGAGKTTTALAILRLLDPKAAKIVSGKIFYHGTDMSAYSERKMQSLRGDKISMIFQNPLTSLNPVFTVG